MEEVKLPPLPQPGIHPKHWAAQDLPAYTPSEMLAYGRECARIAVEAVLEERKAGDSYRWLRDNVTARIAIATEVFQYEKLDVPSAEWLDEQIAAAIREA